MYAPRFMVLSVGMCVFERMCVCERMRVCKESFVFEKRVAECRASRISIIL